MHQQILETDIRREDLYDSFARFTYVIFEDLVVQLDDVPHILVHHQH